MQAAGLVKKCFTRETKHICSKTTANMKDHIIDLSQQHLSMVISTVEHCGSCYVLYIYFAPLYQLHVCGGVSIVELGMNQS